jgi:hypothetical protein
MKEEGVKDPVRWTPVVKLSGNGSENDALGDQTRLCEAWRLFVKML